MWKPGGYGVIIGGRDLGVSHPRWFGYGKVLLYGTSSGSNTESSSHNYSSALASSLEDTHFVVGVDYEEVLPEVVEAEVSVILMVDTDRKLQLIHMNKGSKHLS